MQFQTSYFFGKTSPWQELEDKSQKKGAVTDIILLFG